MTIFFAAEDDPLMCRLYERAFRLAGQEIEIAHDGLEAMFKLQQMKVKPAVVLLDIMMPQMDGFEVLAKMKADETLKNIPVFMLTNLAGDTDKDKALSMGAVGYLIKSDFDPPQVVKKVMDLVGAEEK